MMWERKQIRHPTASTLFILALLVTTADAHALSCAPRVFTLREAYAAAHSIIVGLITECKEEISSDPWANGGQDCSFSSIEVLKESVPARDHSGVADSSACGLSLHVGGQFLLFLDNENQPMRFSTALTDDRHPAEVTGRYLQIIRDFRDGVVDDLAEPWAFAESEGYCSIWHRVRGHQISFSRQMAGVSRQPKPDWIREAINGEPAYRTTIPLPGAESGLPSGDAEIVAFGGIADFADDALTLRVRLADSIPSAPRKATLSVGNRTWSLDRMEVHLSIPGASSHKVVEYFRAGDVAEQILSAMAMPSDIVVSATLIASNIASAPREVPQAGQDLFVPAPSDGVHFAPVARETKPNSPSPTPKVNSARSYGVRENPPEAVLRMESRSTQLSSVMQSFRACYRGVDK